MAIILALATLALSTHGGHHVQQTLTWLARPTDELVGASFFHGALLDHAAPIGSAKNWSQRYYVDARFWGGDGFPVFIYIGGEGPQGAPSPRLLFFTLAEQHQALMLTLEHRFYGESRPTSDMSPASLAFLTSTQALGDLARFHAYISSYSPAMPDTLSTPPLRLPAAAARSKWVSFGGSYPGNLAVWLKQKYPALVAGTVGSSAPVYAKYDFGEYAQVVGAALGYPLIGGSAGCLAAVTAGADALAKIVASGPAGISTLPKALRPCSSISEPLDLATYYGTLMGNFQGVVQCA